MCGIFSAKDPIIFLDLLQENLSRGAYSAGILSIFENKIEIQKIRDINKEPVIVSARALYHLGHVRAPTTKVSNFSGCHPFQYGRAIAAHNGIITNTEDLELDYDLKLDVDSEWIPFLYNYSQEAFQTGWQKFHNVLSRLKGTYGTWLYDVNSNHIMVSRGDNTVYWNKDRTAFSSKAVKDIDQLMPDGAIYSSIVDVDNSVFFDINADNRIQRKPKYFIPN